MVKGIFFKETITENGENVGYHHHFLPLTQFFFFVKFPLRAMKNISLFAEELFGIWLQTSLRC